MSLKLNQRSFQLFNTVVLAVLLLLALVAVLIHFYRLSTGRERTTVVGRQAYQAVFLTNDQVYFGHLDAVDTRYPILDDVYYVQLLPADPNSDKSASTGRVVRLIDSATHKPTNRMILNREQILFWEDLSDRSPILQKIMELKQTVQ
ncbi:MAG: hypothetical protein A3I32_00670 [Candidatus Yanofskybacteria bacterium RIFCSPLOWO2_02_FULL_45_10]|uniref:Uncharacterized protein n=3 Tax=Patescibacteria group TaxID=1783273 RepID=A0A1F8G2L5_9BACT|nr:MAG: hypothetical protein UU67_C0001G0033 [Candidatus Daviesbacteria bacterium GW2011_GWB1_41_5]OGN19565.1 MAG: hypothetical protein A3F25_00485 [Candidatus Yanofskybacteria bacterium RIFCSPHIGHO2_12_FULL_45_19b]OGN32488.1 MAG: hypothetical protein A3I32_00670 [Candidatus Yanofskybacteria bacterium RIFCSPLOWO2_02_FULL_45_10]